jgi:tetratricopeptide (TPR) repeat protein
VGVNSCANATAQLRAAWNGLQELRSSAEGCAGLNAGQCEKLRLEIDRLGQNCPAEEQAQLANAILAYDERQLGKAQQYLDPLLSTPRPNPDAAALRGRIAIEEGNLPYAKRYLREQIRLHGDHAGLREVYASVLFLLGEYAEAKMALAAAEDAGAPGWRIAYGKGLIAEAEEDWVVAKEQFSLAVKSSAGWPRASARLREVSRRAQEMEAHQLKEDGVGKTVAARTAARPEPVAAPAPVAAQIAEAIAPPRAVAAVKPAAEIQPKKAPIGVTPSAPPDARQAADRPIAVAAQPKAGPARSSQKSKLAGALELYREGRRLNAAKDFRGAIAAFTVAIELRPDYALAWNSRGYSRLRLGDYSRAIADLTQAIALDGEYANAYRNRAAAFRMSGKSTEAERDATKARVLGEVF